LLYLAVHTVALLPSRTCCIVARLEDERLKNLADLKDVSSLRDLRESPPGLLRAQMELSQPHDQPGKRSELPAAPRDAKRSSNPTGQDPLSSRKLGTRRGRKVRGSDALQEAAARWAEVPEPLSKGVPIEPLDSDERRQAVEAMMARAQQADVVSALPEPVRDELTELLRAADAAEAEAAAAVSRAAELRARATAQLEMATAREQMGNALSAWAQQHEEENALREAFEAAMQQTGALPLAAAPSDGQDGEDGGPPPEVRTVT